MSQASHQKSRAGSEKKIDLRAIVILPELWQAQQRCDRKSADKEGKVVGFVRVPPDMSLRNLREEVAKQLDEETLPLDYVFLRCVGDFMTVVSKKQELTLKTKSFAPPYTSTPDMYVLSSDCVSPRLINSLASTSRTSLTSPVTSPTSASLQPLGGEPPNNPVQPCPTYPTMLQMPGHSDLLPAPTDPPPLLLGTSKEEELMGSSSSRPPVFEPSLVGVPPGTYGLSPAAVPTLSISLSPTPLPFPHPPASPRDPAMPRSPRLARMRQERSRNASPQPMAQFGAGTGDSFDYGLPPASVPSLSAMQYQQAMASSSSSFASTSPSAARHLANSGTGSSSDEQFTYPSQQYQQQQQQQQQQQYQQYQQQQQQQQQQPYHSTMNGSGVSPSLAASEYGYHHYEVGGVEPSTGTAPIQLLLSQGNNDISLQLGGQDQSASSHLGAASPMPRLDIRIGSASPFRSPPVLPPLAPADPPQTPQATEPFAVRDPSPPPTFDIGSRGVFAAREALMKQQQEEAEQLRERLAEMQTAREAMEKRKKEVLEASKELDREAQRQKHTADEEWKKKYLQEKRKTVPLENSLDDQRKKYAQLHSKPAQQRGRKAMHDAGRVAASEALNNRTVANKLEKEINGLRSRIETLCVQLEKEQEARSRMAQECKQLRDELTDKKITKTLTKKP